MILRERHRPIPTVHVPPWTIPVDPTTETYSPRPVSGVTVNSSDIARGGEHFSPRYLHEALTAFQSYLPSNEQDPSSFPVSGVTINSNGIANGGEHCSSRYLHQALTAFKRYLPSSESDPDPDLDFFSGPDSDAPIDAYSCDQFRMYEFKVRRCARGRSHDWTDCPYVHPGEKARRRDPRKYHYSGTACPEFRKGSCKKGELCEFAHGVFECWLHPARYRTLPCKDGTSCQRRVCFFAHTPEQLRVLPSQSSQNVSPPLSPVDSSPPLSPMNKSPIHEIVASLRRLHLGKVNKSQPGSWTAHVGSPNNIVWSPRGSVLRPELFCLPTTPNGAPSRAGIGYLNLWEQECDEPAMERVESGRGLRVKMFERLLSNENCLERGDPDPSSSRPDLRWVSELVK